MQISLAFQGGGARLVELMAAAAACRAIASSNSDFNVMRASGSSAGAIAAAMYATGCDIGAIVAGAHTLRATVNANFPANRLTKLRALGRLGRGLAIYEETDLRKLIVSLFKLGGVDAERCIKDVVTAGLQLRILRSDVRFNNTSNASETSEARLADALVDSAAIPFALRVPGGRDGRAEILDGGLFQNLPGKAALEGLPSDHVPLGFTFAPDTASDLSRASMTGYAAAILSSLLSERVSDSIGHLKPSNIIELPNRRTTFDFKSVFEETLHIGFSEDVAEVRAAIGDWLKATKLRDGPVWSSDHPLDVMEQMRQTDEEVIRFYEEVGNKSYHADLVHQEIVYQSFNEDMPDFYLLHITLRGDRNPGLQFLRSFFYDAEESVPKRATVSVVDGGGVKREAMMLPIRNAGRKGSRSTLICLDRPLGPGDIVTITKTEESFFGVRHYQNKGHFFETLGLGAGKTADELKITIHFPKGAAPKFFRDASPEHDNEAIGLEDEAGLQVLAKTIKSSTGRVGCDTIESVADVREPSDKRRFIKMVYYKQ